jgi:hypothetical protein
LGADNRSGDGDKGVRVTDRRVSADESDVATMPRAEGVSAAVDGGGHYHADGTFHAHDHDHGEGADSDGMPHNAEPPVDFPTFVLSLSTSALMHMGYGADPANPGTPSPEHANFPLARQTIDLLAMLEKKTTGNLTGEEERLLSEVLFDLRMRFVKLSGG